MPPDPPPPNLPPHPPVPKLQPSLAAPLTPPVQRAVEALLLSSLTRPPVSPSHRPAVSAALLALGAAGAAPTPNGKAIPLFDAVTLCHALQAQCTRSRCEHTTAYWSVIFDPTAAPFTLEKLLDTARKCTAKTAARTQNTRDCVRQELRNKILPIAILARLYRDSLADAPAATAKLPVTARVADPQHQIPTPPLPPPTTTQPGIVRVSESAVPPPSGANAPKRACACVASATAKESGSAVGERARPIPSSSSSDAPCAPKKPHLAVAKSTASFSIAPQSQPPAPAPTPAPASSPALSPAKTAASEMKPAPAPETPLAGRGKKRKDGGIAEPEHARPVKFKPCDVKSERRAVRAEPQTMKSELVPSSSTLSETSGGRQEKLCVTVVFLVDDRAALAAAIGLAGSPFVTPLSLCVRAFAPSREVKTEADAAVPSWIDVRRECGEALEASAAFAAGYDFRENLGTGRTVFLSSHGFCKTLKLPGRVYSVRPNDLASFLEHLI